MECLPSLFAPITLINHTIALWISSAKLLCNVALLWLHATRVTCKERESGEWIRRKEKADCSLSHPTGLLHLGSSLPGLREDGADHALGARVAGRRAVRQAAVRHTRVVGVRLWCGHKNTDTEWVMNYFPIQQDLRVQQTSAFFGMIWHDDWLIQTLRVQGSWFKSNQVTDLLIYCHFNHIHCLYTEIRHFTMDQEVLHFEILYI